MILDTIDDIHVWYHSNQNHNKVWGYFRHGTATQHWAFWGGIGKAWSFKYHGLPWDLLKLSDAKCRKGYLSISLPDLDVLDPTWRIRFSERFSYFLLMHTSF